MNSLHVNKVWIAGYVPQDGEQVEIQRYTQRVNMDRSFFIRWGGGRGAGGI